MRALWLIVACCGFAVLAFNGWLYAWRTRVLRQLPGCDVPDKLGVVDATRAFLKECAALVAVVALVPIGWCLPQRRSGHGHCGAVLLVHGWGLNRGSLWWLQRRLLRDGWSPVWCFEYRSRHADVAWAAEQLGDEVARLAARIPDGRPLTLIGHSLGGLLLRAYARSDPVSPVRRLVTLGTPHFGTAAARLAGSRYAELAPGSAFLTTINTADRVPQLYDVIAIHSTFDAMILPPASAEYPHALNIELNDVGHNALLFSSRVYDLLVENLRAPIPPRLAPIAVPAQTAPCPGQVHCRPDEQGEG